MTIVRRLPHPIERHRSDAGLEWLVTNGLGGYASGAVSGVMTRRHHGVLVAALPSPLGRMVMLSHVQAGFTTANGHVILDPGFPGSTAVEGARNAALEEFRLECGLPIWTYATSGLQIEKRVVMPHRQNTVHVTYRVVGERGRVRLELRPFMHFRHYESPLSEAPIASYTLTACEEQFEVQAGRDLPALRLAVHGRRAALTLESAQSLNPYTEEKHRGYAYDGRVWSPGYFHLDLDVADSPEATLIASTEPWDTIHALSPDEARAAEIDRRHKLVERAVPAARDGVAAELVLAADQFIITPAGRSEEAARAVATGTEARTVIAGYHWFTDWGRDTMISLEGLTLVTGRAPEAAFILRTFAHYVRDGLIPNMFPDGENEGLYHTADATLWYFHAIDRYVRATGDTDLLTSLLPSLNDIVDHHVRGTRFGIHVDPADGLLAQGAPGYQLTWMDAKVDDWVVTPRRGKAVEINALFYNALRLMQGWTADAGDDARAAMLRGLADRVYTAFNERFWYADGGYLYDVIDGETTAADVSCRPNQIMAISLPHAVLAPERWRPVLDIVRERLLTPYGLRSLAPGHPDFRAQYYGDLRSRDAAYHQGTVWAWLIGPFVDAWRKIAPEEEANIGEALHALGQQLSEAGVGSISEIFDAQSPYTPRGCIAQAWSVAELLRVWASKPGLV
jgi:predicted glycogen debranching enzyme